MLYSTDSRRNQDRPYLTIIWVVIKSVNIKGSCFNLWNKIGKLKATLCFPQVKITVYYALKKERDRTRFE